MVSPLCLISGMIAAATMIAIEKIGDGKKRIWHIVVGIILFGICSLITGHIGQYEAMREQGWKSPEEVATIIHNQAESITSTAK